MDTRLFLEKSLEQTQEELEYWKQKYENLEQTCRELICWIKETYKEETIESEEVRLRKIHKRR